MQLNNLLVLGFAALVIILWMVLPLLIAAVIYKLAPDKVISAKGPFQGLNIKATGPFAAYLIVLLGSALIWSKAFDVAIGMSKTKWTVTARVMLLDSNKQVVTSSSIQKPLEKLRVKYDYPLVLTSGYERISVQVPGSLKEWPDLVVEVPNFGEKIIYLNDSFTKNEAKVDYSTATIALEDTVVISESQSDPIGVGMEPQ